MGKSLLLWAPGLGPQGHWARGEGVGEALGKQLLGPPGKGRPRGSLQTNVPKASRPECTDSAGGRAPMYWAGGGVATTGHASPGLWGGSGGVEPVLPAGLAVTAPQTGGRVMGFKK